MTDFGPGFALGLACGYAAGLAAGRQKGPLTPEEKEERGFMKKVVSVTLGCLAVVVIAVLLSGDSPAAWSLMSGVIALSLLVMFGGVAYYRLFVAKKLRKK